jgi:hypothetical protein
MSIIVSAPSPEQLLIAIKQAIDKRNIETWAYDKDGDFTHTPDQWKYQAWLRPVVAPGFLIFGLLGKKDAVMTKVVYAVYHGRFIETLLSHFDQTFSAAGATAQKDSRVDIFK